jgi:hypothetical protein
MATLGTGNITKRHRRGASEVPPVDICAPTVNLVSSPAKVEPAATVGVQPLNLGSPIMREGFITSTGFMLSPSK